MLRNLEILLSRVSFGEKCEQSWSGWLDSPQKGQEGVLRQLGLLWPSLLQTKHLEISVSVLILISLPLIRGGVLVMRLYKAGLTRREIRR